jgi:purine nucleosidase/pyrimidine-specific ribonucleoside hydrolase
LDVATHFDVNFSEAEIDQLSNSPNSEAAFLLQMLRFVTNRGFQSYCVLIDSMAVAAAIEPTLVSLITAKVGVETKGELTLGMTVMDTRHHFQWANLPDIQIAYEADYQRFLTLVINTILT